MNIQHYEKNFQYTDKEYLSVARKLGKIATYCKRVKDDASYIRIDTEKRNTKKDRDSIKVTISVELPKKSMRAESRKSDIIEAVDRCLTKLEPQLKRFKEKTAKRSRTRKRTK